MSTPERAELFDAYLRGSVTEEQKQELAGLLQDETGKQEFAEYVQMSGLMIRAASRLEAENADEAIEAASRAMPSIKLPLGARQTRGRRRRSVLRPMFVLVAACIALVAGYIFLHQPVPENIPVSIARITETSPDNIVIREDDRLTALPEMALLLGDHLHTPSGNAWVRYVEEGIAVEIMAGTELSFASHNLLLLEKGLIDCSVDGVRLANSFNVKTPHGIIDVLGTRFKLQVKAAETLLEVTEGIVKLTRSDGAAVEVQAGQFAIAAPGKNLIAAVMEKPAFPSPGIVNLIEGNTLEASGWRHDLRPEGTTRFVEGFALNQGMLIKGLSEQRVRLIKDAAFNEGEISFTFNMTRGYWSFMVRDDIHSNNFYEAGLETEFKGRHKLRLQVKGADVKLFIDGRERSPGKGFKIEGDLDKPLTSPSILRFHVAPDTKLTISDMKITTE